eukprot:PhF_6_TR43155/c0_g1_i2/m.66079
MSEVILIRHGQSIANERKIICSKPSNGTSPEYGLTHIGRQQAEQTGREIRQKYHSNKKIVMFSSPYTRALQTAQIVATALGIPTTSIIITEQLRERDFGNYELGSDNQYNLVWDIDKTNADNRNNCVESPNQVATRCREVLAMAAAAEGDVFIFVAHGDVLQIMQCVIQNMCPSQHRSVKHMNQAEARGFDQAIRRTSKL